VADKVLFSQVRFPNPFVDVYDARADAWTVRRLPQNRAEIEVAAVGTQVLFVSGQAGQGPSAAVDIFEGTTGNWKSAALSAARRGPAVAVVGGKVIVAGGRGPDPSSAVDIYDSSNDSWTVDRLPVARGVISAAAAANSVVFAGGSVGEPISYSGWVDILRVSE
jgi:hypothetical protein